MAVIDRIRARRTVADDDDSGESLRYDIDSLINQVNFLGHNYPMGLQTSLGGSGDEERPDTGFSALVQAAYRSGGPVFSCILARGLLFSEARFQWQRFNNGRPADLFGTPALSLLEEPWPRGTTGELLWRAEQDVSLGGNFFVRRSRDRLWRIRPDRVTIVLGSQMDVTDPTDAIDAEIVGYFYEAPKSEPMSLLPEEVAHWAPIPDPLANYRGMSWVSPLIKDVQADNDAVVHKGQFFRKGATVNIVVLPDASIDYDQFKKFRDDFADKHEGSINAYKTLFLGGGSRVEKLGSSMKDMEYKHLMGISETRIASAAGVPPIIAGFSEGLASATYSNYGMARRKFGDHWARPQWRSFAASVAHLLERPQGGVRLWYDDRDIAFLREDTGDEAKIRQTDAITLRQLIEAGYDPDAAATYVQTGNISVLFGEHSGNISVQLQPMDGSAGELEPVDGDEDDDDGADPDDVEPEPPGFGSDDDDEDDE